MKKRKNNNFKVVKYSSLKEPEKEEDELSSAEMKLKEAQEEIEKIKNKQRSLYEAERKLDEEKKELRRLRRDFRQPLY